MSKVVGLDLGTNSIGWAIVENDKILGIGSRIFQEGVINLGEGEGRETSKNASRSEARGKRKQFFRKRLRKRYLLRVLAKHNMCPLNPSEIKDWNGSAIFSNSNLQDWLKLNPYELRARALYEKITLLELGRIYYHMIQRRGFQSNSRSAGADNNDKSVIYKGDSKVDKIGINDTEISIQKNKTLGNYLHSILPEENVPYKGELERIRNRYTTRQMYIEEFESIWKVQSQYHQELTRELKTIVGGRKKDGYSEDGVLFHQRPLRSQKHLVGYCSFEPKKTKCPVSAISFEQFRVYQWVNTVDCNEKISAEERDKICKLLFSKERVKFKEIRKCIDKLDNFYQFNYKDDDVIAGTHTISQLSHSKFFGKQWSVFSQKEQEDIWHVLYFFDDREKLKEYAQTKWKFTEEKALKISKFNLKQGYANLSRKAIENILPFLTLGFMYDIAVALGGVKNALGENFEKHEQIILDNIPEIVRFNAKGGYINHLKKFLTNECALSEVSLKKLYHHSSAIEKTALLAKLPMGPDADKEIQSIKNPVVITALFEIRKLVNELIDVYGKPDEVKIELARDLKASKSNRYNTRREQKRLENENNRIKKELEQLNQRITTTNLLKYKLWEECNRTCPYTGKIIELNQLFSGAVQIEHIHPWSRSLNDSFMNKTLCFADENRAKGNLTPYEFYSKQGSEKWENIKLQALSCFKNKAQYPNAYRKFKHFVSKRHNDDFISRQLNDTRYISKEAKNYVSKICDNVMVAPGQMTAKLRHHWGLNSILNEDNTKTRDDHRHHAIDALVMACATRSHLQELSKWNRYNRNYDLKDFSMPWEGFRQDAEKSVDQILVSHKKPKHLLTIRTHKTKRADVVYQNKGIAARGQLHKENVYGKRTAPNSDESFHIRKPIESLKTKKQLDKVVDESIRILILKRIQELGGFVNEKNIPENTFFTTDGEGNKIPQIYLPNKSGKPVPVKKVRMKENFGGAEQVKDDLNQYVNPRNNHHVLIYKDEAGNLKESIVTFWTAVERKRQGQAVVQLPEDGKEIVTTLQINDMFLLGLNEDEIDWDKPNNNLLRNHLYRVQKLSSKFYEFRLNSESLLNKNHSPFYNRIQSFGSGITGWNTFNPLKIKLSAYRKN